MRNMTTWHKKSFRDKKSFREWMLNLCGYEIWPPTHNDPTIKGPQPRIISKRQRNAMEKAQREALGDVATSSFGIGESDF